MKYEWKAAFERVTLDRTVDGEIENHQTIRRAGEIEETQSGYNVVKALIESNLNVGNLVYLEVKRVV